MAERSISDQLSDYGIRHESGGDRRRHIYWHSRSLGLMDAQEACELLALLKQPKRTVKMVNAWDTGHRYD